MAYQVGHGSEWKKNPLEGYGGSQTGATSLLPSNTSGMEGEGDYPLYIHIQGGISCWCGVIAKVVTLVGFITILMVACNTLFAKINELNKVSNSSFCWLIYTHIFLFNRYKTQLF